MIAHAGCPVKILYGTQKKLKILLLFVFIISPVLIEIFRFRLFHIIENFGMNRGRL